MRIREVDRAILEEPVVRENQQLLRHRSGERIVRGANDDAPIESLPYRETGAVVGMRVVPVGARRPATHGERVLVRRARRDRMVGAAVRIEWKMDPVPVNGGR